MDATLPEDRPEPVLHIDAPAEQRLALVFASPHSGSRYPLEFLEQSALDPQSLRRSEDSFVDELFGDAPRLGAPLIKALFPRAYLDPNREPYELDPTMFDGPLPRFVNSKSPRVSAGLGTVARLVATGAEIYRGKLSFAEVERRIETLYRPYHSALAGLVEATLARFGHCILVDCHSMPSVGGPTDRDSGASRVDVVLGDCFGTACASVVTHTAETVLRQLGYRVVRNSPYAGGYTTRHYGSPGKGSHALQIELNRRLYMDERSHMKRPAFEQMRANLAALVVALAQIPAGELTP